MQNSEWILIDTETTGFVEPIYVVELAAQLMRGWEPAGPSFRRLINHGADIPPEAARVHGYTKEILERDGDSPVEVYDAFAAYVRGRPIVAYNLPYDLDKVLVPEWKRLGIATIGRRGFCALALTQRLLDPVPAGNCKLQTLRQYYRLPERGAHTALGDVETVIDLARAVWVPLLEQRGLASWKEVVEFSEQEWFASKIAFGKHKGRNFREAVNDSDFYSWLEWLSSSSNERSAAMGGFYLRQLTAARNGGSQGGNFFIFTAVNRTPDVSKVHVKDVVIYSDPDIAELKSLIEHARNRLAELSAEYMTEKRAVDATSAALFERLKAEYRLRDELHVTVIYRRRYINTLLELGEQEAETLPDEFEAEKKKIDDEHAEASRSASQSKALNDDERAEIKVIWRKLARVFHPDQVFGDEQVRGAHEQLFAIVNNARDLGNVALLREIALDPNLFMQRQGWNSGLKKADDSLTELRDLYSSLSLQIIERIDEFDTLRSSNGFQVLEFCRKHHDGFEQLVVKHRQMLELEIENLRREAEKLLDQASELLGKPSLV